MRKITKIKRATPYTANNTQWQRRASYPVTDDGTTGASLEQSLPLKRSRPVGATNRGEKKKKKKQYRHTGCTQQARTRARAKQTKKKRRRGDARCKPMFKNRNATHPTFAAHSTEPRMATTQAQQPDVSPAFFAQSVYAWMEKRRKKNTDEKDTTRI